MARLIFVLLLVVFGVVSEKIAATILNTTFLLDTDVVVASLQVLNARLTAACVVCQREFIYHRLKKLKYVHIYL